MERNSAILTTVTTVIVALLSSGCAPSYGFTRSLAGNDLRTEFCAGVRSFVRASLDNEGLRRAWFLPLGVYEDGSIDFYAPMSGEPMDDAASEFHEKRAGQLTHYTTASEFAFEVSKCLSRSHDFKRVSREMTDDRMTASYIDTHSGRSIEIRAEEQTTSILVADSEWSGDLDSALTHGCSFECETE